MMSACNLSKIFIEQRDFDNAYTYALRAIRYCEAFTVPYDRKFLSMPYYNFGMINLKLGNMELSKQAYEFAFYLSESTAYDEDWVDYALVLSGYDKAQSLDILKRCEVYYPMDPMLYYYRFFMYYQMGDYANAYEEALFGLQTARQNNAIAQSFVKVCFTELPATRSLPESVGQFITNLNLAIIYTSDGRHYREALECCSNALTYKPDSLYALLTMAEAHRIVGKSELAIPCFEKVIAGRPTFLWAYLELADCYKQLRRFD
jgi:tetratricopeptide (TPR) repeat protein